MNLFKGLSQYLLVTGVSPREKFDSWMEQASLVYIGKHDEQGFNFCNMSYQAVFVVESYRFSPEILFCLVLSWLKNNDVYRSDLDLNEPSFDIDIIDNKTADVEIRIEFDEPIYLVEDENGLIEIDGKRWTSDNFIFDTAESVGINNA